MCGIAGIYAYHYAAPDVCRDEATKMLDRLYPRGPDGNGMHYSSDGRLALGHRRLSIIDPDQRSSQPMKRHGAIISYNGEIYNFKELRSELESKGFVFTTTSDTEVLLALWNDLGVSMLWKLRGMFAIAIWDTRTSSLSLARDPFGIKPLFYANDGWTVRFASQVKSILAGNRVSRTVDPGGVAGFYLFGSVPEPFTVYESIRALGAGKYLLVNSLGVSEERTWCDTGMLIDRGIQQGRGETSSNEHISHAVEDSVARHLIADTDVCTYLSSGVDSTAIAASVAKILGPEQRTITLRFEEFLDDQRDEGPFARQTAQILNSQHTERFVSRQEFEQDIDKILDAMDQPTIDGVNSWFIAKATRESGYKVGLSGVGGDEILGGYPSFTDIPRSVKLISPTRILPGSGRISRAAIQRLSRRMNWSPKLASVVEYGGSWAGAWLLRRGIFMPWELAQIMGKDEARQGLKKLDPLRHIAERCDLTATGSFARVAALETSLYMRNQLLRDLDWASMAHSVEARTPLVDITLLKAVSPYFDSHIPRFKKAVLKPLIPDSLSTALFNKPKTGFTTPISGWLSRSATLDIWKRIPGLNSQNCPWARRLAYSVKESYLG